MLAAEQGRGDLAVADIMGSLTLDRSSAEGVLTEALCLAAHPATAEAVHERRLSLPQGRALLQVLGELPPELADQVEGAVLGDIQRLAGRPPARVRELARREALRLDPAGAAERRRAAARRRHLGMRDAGDGMVLLSLLVRAEHGLAVLHRAEQETLHDDGSGRTRDQRRADWVVDVLLTEPGQAEAAETTHAEQPPSAAVPGAEQSPRPEGREPSADAPGADQPDRTETQPPSAGVPGAALVLNGRRRRPVQVLVHVPVTTALGLGDAPCELAEVGPIDAAHGLLLLSTAELRKVCVDAVTGQVLHVEDAVVRPTPDATRVSELGGGADALAQATAEAIRRAVVEMVLRPSVLPVEPEVGYRPSASLSRTVKTRHPRCDFLTCSCPSRNADDEHDRPWQQGGETSARNLSPRSRWCHRAKQRGWTAHPLPDGSTLWTSPSGRQYPAYRQHHPPPPVPGGAVLPLPTPAPARDADGPDMWGEVQGTWPPPLDEPALPPPPPARMTWPDEAPF